MLLPFISRQKLLIILLFTFITTIILVHQNMLFEKEQLFKKMANTLSILKAKLSNSTAKRIENKPYSPNINTPKIDTNNSINVYESQSEPDNFQKSSLRCSKGTGTIYVYDRGDLISRRILRSQTWEAGYISAMEQWFDKDSGLHLIDIGCNLGVYSIVGGMRGRKVVAVDANINNIKRLRKSILDNKLQDKVTLVYNGISDVYSTFVISSPEAGNIGLSLLAKPGQGNKAQLVKSIYLDDLLSVISFKKAIMKIDIEGHEFEAFHKADKLFTQVNIPAVMMEWKWLGKHADQQIPHSVKSFFIKFGYKAYPSLNSASPLNLNNHKSWPWDIVWKK